ncbi:MAG: hypothetical protein RIQ81_1296 [Pseudomonadota bacterium]
MITTLKNMSPMFARLAGIFLLAWLSWKTVHYIFLSHRPPRESRQTYRPDAAEILVKRLDWREALNAKSGTTLPWFDSRLPPVNQPASFPYEVSPLGGSWFQSPEKAPWRDGDLLRLADKKRFSISAPGLPRSIAWMGTLHSHTGWSDGEKNPHDAYIHAREDAQLDFFAVTDHPEYWLFNPERNFSALRDIAAMHGTQNFTALAGFEYSHPVFGHYVVIGSEDVCSAVKCPTVADFYQWLKLPRNAGALFAFAHPLQQKDNASRYEFLHMKHDPELTEKMFGVEVIHWDGHDRYLFGFGGDQPFIDEALKLGWQPGSLASQDNHRANWGQSANRVAVLSAENNRTAMFDALRRRRFYATSSPTLQLYLDVKAAGSDDWQPMGGHLACRNGTCRHLDVRLRMFESDRFMVPRRIDIVLGGQIIARKDFTTLPHELASAGTDPTYYAGELSTRIPLDQAMRPNSTWLYARVYLGSSMDRMAQTSPLIISRP